jgi:hypothetical protein
MRDETRDAHRRCRQRSNGLAVRDQGALAPVIGRCCLLRPLNPLSRSEGVDVRLRLSLSCLHGRQRMEHLWSRAVATGGKRWQMGRPRKRLGQAKTVAVGCDQLPIGAHGKEGSTVRVRQRASASCLLSRPFRLSGSTSSPSFGVHRASRRGRRPLARANLEADNLVRPECPVRALVETRAARRVYECSLVHHADRLPCVVLGDRDRNQAGRGERADRLERRT